MKCLCRAAISIFDSADSAPLTPPGLDVAVGPLYYTHVYHPLRLIVKQQCIAVAGMIVDATAGKKSDGVRHEADGDRLPEGGPRVCQAALKILLAGFARVIAQFSVLPLHDFSAVPGDAPSEPTLVRRPESP